jgi:hypothetical protein
MYNPTGTQYAHVFDHQTSKSASASTPREEGFDGEAWDNLSDLEKEDEDLSYETDRQRRLGELPPAVGQRSNQKVAGVFGGIVESGVNGARRLWEIGEQRIVHPSLPTQSVVVPASETANGQRSVYHAGGGKMRAMAASVDFEDEATLELIHGPGRRPLKDDGFTEVTTVGPSQRVGLSSFPITVSERRNIGQPVQGTEKASHSVKSEPREREGYDSDFDVPGGVDWPLDAEADKRHQAKMRAERLAYEERVRIIKEGRERLRMVHEGVDKGIRIRLQNEEVELAQVRGEGVDVGGSAMYQGIVPMWTEQIRQNRESRGQEESGSRRLVQSSTLGRGETEQDARIEMLSTRLQEAEAIRHRRELEDRHERKAKALMDAAKANSTTEVVGEKADQKEVKTSEDYRAEEEASEYSYHRSYISTEEEKEQRRRRVEFQDERAELERVEDEWEIGQLLPR